MSYKPYVGFNSCWKINILTICGHFGWLWGFRRSDKFGFTWVNSGGSGGVGRWGWRKVDRYWRVFGGWTLDLGWRKVEAGECSVTGHGLGLVGWWCWREGRSMLAGVRWLNMDLGWRKVGLLRDFPRSIAECRIGFRDQRRWGHAEQAPDPYGSGLLHTPLFLTGRPLE